MATNNPTFAFGEDKRYLIRVDKKVMGMINDEDEAIKTISLFASAEEKKLVARDCSVFWKHLDNGRKIQLYTQSQGTIFHGSLVPEVTIDIIMVKHLKYISPYADKIAQYKKTKQ